MLGREGQKRRQRKLHFNRLTDRPIDASRFRATGHRLGQSKPPTFSSGNFSPRLPNISCSRPLDQAFTAASGPKEQF